MSIISDAMNENVIQSFKSRKITDDIQKALSTQKYQRRRRRMPTIAR